MTGRQVNIAAALRRAARPVLINYMGDLDSDIETLTAADIGARYLWTVRESGTHLIRARPALPDYAAPADRALNEARRANALEWLAAVDSTWAGLRWRLISVAGDGCGKVAPVTIEAARALLAPACYAGRAAA